MSKDRTQGAIIGSVFERKTGLTNKQPTTSKTTSTGFPTVQHRSKSAFARNREDNLRKKPGSSRLQAPPVVGVTARDWTTEPCSTTAPSRVTSSELGSNDAMRDHIGRENEARLAGMTPEEIEDERRQILERFGTGIGSVLERARRNRMKNACETSGVHRTGATSPPPALLDEVASKKALQDMMEVPISPEERSHERARSPPPSALANPISRPSSRASRRLRFAELEPKDVYVYESHPPSPRRAVFALPAPSSNDGDAVSLGTWQGRMAQPDVPMQSPAFEGDAAASTSSDGEHKHEPEAPPGSSLEEGTPEDIRRRFFPDLPANDPNLAWMSLHKEATDATPSPSLRFDLHGNPISSTLSSQLPTTLGLHHHAEGSHAGYTLDDIFLLSRSTVPSQRAIMFDILAGITRLLSRLKKGEAVPQLDELRGKEEELRKRIVAAGVEALNEKGSVGLRAMELVWQCVVAWDRDSIALGLEGIWLESAEGESIRSLSLAFILPSFSYMLNQNHGAYPHEFLVQLLEIIQRLALENKQYATRVVDNDKLLSGIVRYFLLSPHTQSEGSHLPDPEAIQLLTSLARTSRQVAERLARSFSDDILRFIAILPDTSPFPSSLAVTLLARSLDFYATLGNYGLCTNVPSNAMEQISRVNQYATSSSTSAVISSSWARLVEVWITCAVDPHATTPPHAITWSRISAWGWQSDLLTLLEHLDYTKRSDWSTCGTVWGALAAWIEGVKVNGIRGGEKERAEMLPAIRLYFEPSGRAATAVSAALDSLVADLQSNEPLSLHRMKGMAASADVLRSAIRLWLAFVPPHVEGPPDAPSFDLPIDRISALAASLLSSSIWSIVTPPKTDECPPECRYCTIYLRHLSGLLVGYLSLSRRLPAMTRDLWLAQAFSIILRLSPGDEDAALSVIDEVLRVLPSSLSDSDSKTKAPSFILGPFVREVVLSRAKGAEDEDDDETQIGPSEPRTRLGPLAVTPHSIQSSTTLVLISPFSGPNSQRQFSGLPLHRDWTLSAMDHLLHSGDSVALRQLPVGWDASEVEVTRMSFEFALKSRDILSRFKLGRHAISKNEAILACMKVFMLEHGLEKDAVISTEEVFRDKTVEALMESLLEPYRLRALSRPTTLHTNEPDLEKLAIRFLGAGTPFYQFYSDFLGLYDAISFSHPLFASLLLPPLAMQYAIDYRKLFWSDYPQILRTIGVRPNQVPSSNIREFLYPVEKEPQVIGSFLSALVKNGATEFLWWVALHHIACNIWVDLRDEEVDGKLNEDRAVKLLKAVVDQGDNEVVVQVIRYSQARLGEGVSMPPQCFDVSQDVLARRKQWIEEAIGDVFANRLGGLLSAT